MTAGADAVGWYCARSGTWTDLCGGAFALERTSQVVDNYTSSPRAEKCSICLAQTAASSSDDDNLAVEPQLACHSGKGTVLERRDDFWTSVFSWEDHAWGNIWVEDLVVLAQSKKVSR